MLIIWLQGIWLPLHGYNFSDTPLWAGIFLLPLTVGFITAGPISGYLSDRYGARPFATTGMVLFAVSFIGLIPIPVNFPYWEFALLCLVNGIGSGMFAAPNTSAIMSSVPPNQRGQASGMRATFMNSGQAISIGIFFSLLITGLHATLPRTLRRADGPRGPLTWPTHVAHLPPVSLGVRRLPGLQPDPDPAGPHRGAHPPAGPERGHPDRQASSSPTSYPPFHHGLVVVFTAADVMALWPPAPRCMRGKRYVHGDAETPAAGQRGRLASRASGTAGV